MNPLTSSLVPPEPRTNPQRVRRSLGDGREKESERETKERHDSMARGKEREKERERREGNVARAESPVQTLSRAFSIMQIESDWLRSGFSAALLSFRAPEFSPRYASASCPTSTLSDSPRSPPLLSPRIRPYSMFDQRDQRAPAPPRKLYPGSQRPNFPWPGFLLGRTELLKSFDGPSDSRIYIVRLTHVAGAGGRGRGEGGGKRRRGERSETGKLIEL